MQKNYEYILIQKLKRIKKTIMIEAQLNILLIENVLLSACVANVPINVPIEMSKNNKGSWVAP